MKVVETNNASVDGLVNEKDKGKLSWNETENALPLPFDKNNAADSLLLRLTDIEQQLGREPLRVVNLEPGSYQMFIDDKTIGTFTAAEFGAGINLALNRPRCASKRRLSLTGSAITMMCTRSRYTWR